MIARTRALTPGSQCSHYADHRHPECVNMCTVCNNSSYLRLCLTPSIHSLWPVWGLSKQTPALFMPGLKPQTTIDHAGPACHPSQFFSDTDISGRQHTRIYFLPVCVCVTPALPLSHKEISVADKKLSRGQGPMVITWTRGERGEPARITN